MDCVENHHLRIHKIHLWRSEM